MFIPTVKLKKKRAKIICRNHSTRKFNIKKPFAMEQGKENQHSEFKYHL